VILHTNVKRQIVINCSSIGKIAAFLKKKKKERKKGEPLKEIYLSIRAQGKGKRGRSENALRKTGKTQI